MSKYRTLSTQENNDFLSPFAVENMLYKTEKQKISPSSPVPEQISSIFNPKSFSHQKNQYNMIKSNEYKSLRYYGNGPY